MPAPRKAISSDDLGTKAEREFSKKFRLFCKDVVRSREKLAEKELRGYQRFIQEFFDGNSPSGLQELKVHQINNESDKIWFGRGNSKEIIDVWREERFRNYS